jgi:dihydropteroate synthase
MDNHTQTLRYPAPKLGIALSSSAQLYLMPAEIVSGPFAAGLLSADRAVPLAQFGHAFSSVHMAARTRDSLNAYHLNVKEARGLHDTADEILSALQAPLPIFAGMDMNVPIVMGIVNATPDSFSNQGEHYAAEDAIAAALSMVEAGARIIDVGGESTRPGAEIVPVDEEIRRIEPVVRALANKGICVSIDTRNAATMAFAVSCGARIINDVTALTGDADAMRVVASCDAGVILMHMQGEPQTMQHSPDYAFAPFDVFDYLRERVAACEAAGIDRSRLCVDPGIGFGKTMDHNLSIMRWLGIYRGLGLPVLLGVSRKSLIQHVCGDIPPQQRVPGSLALAVQGVRSGANIVRVHDVPETVQALRMVQAVQETE